MQSATDSDVLVLGAGPAGLAIAAALGEAGLSVTGLAPQPPDAPWPNTYGIWEDELAPLGLTHLLAHRWTNCVSWTDAGPIRHQRVYGLLDREALQAHLLERGRGAGVTWRQGLAAGAAHDPRRTLLTTRDGAQLAARLLVDATGHRPVLLRRPAGGPIAFQAAYGIVGRFSRPPVAAGQLLLMDYRTDHLPAGGLDAPPTFLYAMDLGDNRYFVEETSLAAAPAVDLGLLEQRLYRRLERRGIAILEREHVEHCLFPMNLPLPDLRAPLLGYGGAASMVHPASGYQVGAALKRAAPTAAAVAAALADPQAGPARAARAGWNALWPVDRRRKRALYLFGLQNMMRFDDPTIQAFFRTFFDLPYAGWSGYLSDRLTTTGLMGTMLRLFITAPMPVRRRLASSIVTQGGYLWRALVGKG